MTWLKKQKETEHRYVEEQLSAYLDGELLPKERQAVEQHLAVCPACRWNLNTLRQTVEWTSGLPAVRVPRAFTIPVPAQPARVARKWRFVPVLQGATALVALLLFFAVAGDVVLTGLQPVAISRPTPQTLAVEMTSPAPGADAEQAGVVVEETVIVEKTVVVEDEVEVLMMQESPAAEAPAAAEAPTAEKAAAAEASARLLAEAPAEVMTVTAAAELRATMAPAGAGEVAADAREETPIVAEGEGTATASEPRLALEAPPVSPTATAVAEAAPALEAAPTGAAMAPPLAEVGEEEALSAPVAGAQSDRGYDIRSDVLSGVRWAEYILGVLLIVLVGTTIGAMVWRRSRR